MSPLNEGIEDLLLLDFHVAVDFSRIQGLGHPSENYIAVDLEDPLDHLIAFAPCRTKDSAQHFLIERKFVRLVFLAAAPFAETKLAKFDMSPSSPRVAAWALVPCDWKRSLVVRLFVQACLSTQ